VGHVIVSKACVVTGCTGTMDFHERRLEGTIYPAHWEFPWFASWRCRQDSAHVQLISHAEEREIVRQALAGEREKTRLERANADRRRALRKKSK